MADICKLNINGVIYDIKDSVARAIIETLQNEGYLKSTDVIDSLVSTNSTAPLSANQGRQLNINKIDNISINGNILAFYANGTSKGTITLPTQSSNGGLTAEQVTQLLTAYTHSQSSHAPSNAEQNVQSDWNVTDNNSDAYIKNKPTKISSFTNDSKYATETFVTTKIAEAQLNGGEVDLSGYATKSEIPTKTSQLENDSGYITDISNLKLAYDSSTGVVSLMYNNNTLSTIIIESSSSINNYSIINNLSNVTTNNVSGSILEGSSYTATITANSGYTINTIKVSMGGVDITSSAVSGNTINISEVTSNIVITASASQTQANTYTITNNLTNCTTDNSSASVLEGDSYLSTITANDEYTLTNVSVTMDGVNVTNSVYSQLSYAVINSLTNCTSDNLTKEISYGSSYSATITANDGYDISSIKVIMNGIDITDDVIEESE